MVFLEFVLFFLFLLRQSLICGLDLSTKRRAMSIFVSFVNFDECFPVSRSVDNNVYLCKYSSFYRVLRRLITGGKSSQSTVDTVMSVRHAFVNCLSIYKLRIYKIVSHWCLRFVCFPITFLLLSYWNTKIYVYIYASFVHSLKG